jgi:hypothetical protein
MNNWSVHAGILPILSLNGGFHTSEWFLAVNSKLVNSNSEFNSFKDNIFFRKIHKMHFSPENG